MVKQINQEKELKFLPSKRIIQPKQTNGINIYFLKGIIVCIYFTTNHNTVLILHSIKYLQVVIPYSIYSN